MALTPSDIIVTLSPNPVGIVVGMNGNITLSFSNTNAIDRAYNLRATLKLPDGLSFVSSTISPDSIINEPDGSITVSWLSIKDLAPNEIGYTFSVTLLADEFFRASGLPVPFDIPISSVDLTASVDTLPRGNDDIGNVVITKNTSENYLPLRYNIQKSAPGKIPKGAGQLSPIVPPLWTYEYTLTIMNNTRLPSEVTLIDNLPNGVRFLGFTSITGPDSVALSSPTIITPSPGPMCQDFVTIDWGNVILSAASVNIIKFEAAIWDNFTTACLENSGARIPHMTPLTNIATLDGLSGPIQVGATTNAMDATINKSVSSSVTDVSLINNYTLTYRINQYDDIGSFTITDIVSNGQSYNIGSASLAPSIITVNPDGTTTLVWNLGLQTAGSFGTITFTTTVNPNFVGGGPVSSDDTIVNNVFIDGINQATSTQTPDSSQASSTIRIPTIKKELLGYFYKDGTPKTISVLAPQDEAEFRISYSSLGITATQQNIEIDEYAPLNMGPLTAALPVTYGGTLPGPFVPFTVSPNGLRWSLGNVSGNSLWTATFRIPVQNIDFVGERSNLAKLAGQNTEGLSYSKRDQVDLLFGQPNIIFTKTVTGPDINAIKSGEIYTYSITIENPLDILLNVTDAFEMELTDTIPTGLTYTGVFSVVGSGSFDPPIFIGQNVSMLIKKLAPNQSLTLNFNVSVDPTIVSGEAFTNNAVLQRPYSQPDRSYQFPGLPFVAQTTLRALAISLEKLISPSSAKIGDIVNYIIQATVPTGTTAYNLVLTDTFPAATQSFIVGSATINGSPVVPTVVGGTVTFPTIPFVDATSSAVLIIYSFDIRVTGGSHVPPFIENQPNTGVIAWDESPIGPPAFPVSITQNLQVITPNLSGLKEQSNITQGISFRVQNVPYNVGDTIAYRLTITNNGAAPAFDSVITDVINPLLSFNAGSFIATKGTATHTAGTINWNIPILLVEETATLTFTVSTLPGAPAGGNVRDSASFIYNSNNNGFGILFGPNTTNTVTLRPTRVDIEKSSNILVGEVGDDITYTITITVATGTIAYTPIVSDILPIGQTYIGPATRQEPPALPVAVIPTISGQTITFPTNPDIDASAGEKQIIYTFIARITDATRNPPYQETQQDRARVRWATQSGGPTNQQQDDTLNITVRTPNLVILKEQRNFTTGGSYTTEKISALPGDTVYYRITVTSNGASPAYNIILQDLLSDDLSYIGIISGPTAGSIIPPGPPPGATLGWNIPILNNGSSATVEFAVSLNSLLAAGSTIPDDINGSYDSNDVNPATYSVDSNIVIIDIPLLELLKSGSPSVAAIGNTITYSIDITVPSNVVAYNLTIKDIIPTGQQYVIGSWSPGVPIIVGNIITYTVPISPVTGPTVLSFIFQTVVVSGGLTPPYIKIQTNNVEIEWDLTPVGPPVAPVEDSFDVEIRTPNIVALKEQRNVTAGGSFTTGVLLGVATNDIVEYRLTLTNNGANTAYNVITTDALDPLLTFSGVVAPAPPGTVIISVPPGTPDGTITWTESSINTGQSVVLIFSVLVNAGPPAGTAVLDRSFSLFDTALINPTTLGPIPSNQVGFNYTLPEIIKNSDKTSYIVGETILYTVAITIPNGNIAYNVQVVDTLPANQSYVADSLTRNGVPLLTPTLTFPAEGTIDATGGEVTIVYTFEALINSITSPPQETQTNTATINWDISPFGTPGTPQIATRTVNVTSSTLNLSKAQRNITASGPGPYTTLPINCEVGDLIYYEFTVTNPDTVNTLYNVIIKDILSTLLSYQGVFVSPPFGVITHTGGMSGGTITWTLPSIPPNTSYSAVVGVIVLNGGGSQGTIPDTLFAQFAATSLTQDILYGPIDSNTVILNLPSVTIEKAVFPAEVSIGEIVTYTLIVKVPKGTIAYNVKVSDTLPTQQIYANNAKKDGMTVFPSVIGQTITFDTEPILDASAAELIITYMFDARVVIGNPDPPYTQIQNNIASVNYDIDREGTPAIPSDSSVSILAKTVFIFITKEQRNITKGTGYTIDPLPVESGDIVEYRIVAHNLSAAFAYNIEFFDILEDNLEFLNFVSVTSGSANYNPATKTIDWSIPVLKNPSIEILIFEVQITEGIAAGGSDDNFGTYFYDTNNTTPITIGPTNTNLITVLYPLLRIEKISDIQNASIGNIITYTVNITVPKGTTALNIQFTDIIPVGQQYANEATLNGNPIIPQILGHDIIFPIIPFIEATNTDFILQYKFKTEVISAIIDPITQVGIQENSATVTWFIDSSTPAPPQSAIQDIRVTKNSIELTKLQRNATQGENFTSNNIFAQYLQVVEFLITVTNNGPNTNFNIIVFDTLSNDLSFIETISVSIGTLTHSGEPSGGTITWSISQLDTMQSANALFSLRVLKNTGGFIHNQSSATFTITRESIERFGPQLSNETKIQVPGSRGINPKSLIEIGFKI